MDASFFRLRTGCQWNALSATGLCSSSSAHRRFQEWRAAGVFLELWRRGLTEYDALKGIDWRWLAADGAMTKAPLGGENHGAQSDGSRQAGHEAQRAHRGEPRPHRAGGRRRQPA
jgi:transposase